MWAGEDSQQPVIVTVREPSGDRLRFSIAHELAHLVMHSPISGTVQELEREADRFAAEFLLPAEGIRRDVGPPVTLAGLVALKPKWRSSIASLIRRVRDLGIVSEAQYRYLMKQLTARGWRKEEPEALAILPEKPRAIRRMAEVVYGIPIDHEKLASAVSISGLTAKEILEAHADVSELRKAFDSSRTSPTLMRLAPPDRSKP